MELLDAYLASLPPVSYDLRATGVQREAAAIIELLRQALRDVERLRAEQDPAATAEAITDWESTYGLPDPCAGASSTLDRRRADLVNKMRASLNLSRAQMVAIAEQLGYTGVRLVEFGPASCTGPCDQPLYDDGWKWVWAISVAEALRTHWATCTGPSNQPLRRWGNEPLYCALSRHKPAHTLALARFRGE